MTSDCLEFLTALAAPYCHQLPERSQIVDGVTAAFCHRCVGIHIGFLSGAVAAFRPIHASRSAWGVAFALIVVAAVDAIGLTSGPWGRSLSGAAGGLGLGLVAAPLVARRLMPPTTTSENDGRVRGMVAASLLGGGVVSGAPEFGAPVLASVFALVGALALQFTLFTLGLGTLIRHRRRLAGVAFVASVATMGLLGHA